MANVSLSNPRIIKKCSVAGCSKKYLAKGYCSTHYYRIRLHGDLDFISVIRRTGQKCLVQGCSKDEYCKRYCTMHYQRLRKFGNTRTVMSSFGEGSTPAERFWSRVDKTPGFGPRGDCWEWPAKPGSIVRYGQIIIDGRRWVTHRYSWFLVTGEDSEKHILHHCDNPPCVNPSHLFEGTNADNIRDKVSKGRQSRGEKHSTAKLTETQVLEIRGLLRLGTRKVDIAKMFSVHPMTIRWIELGRAWGWLTGITWKGI